MELFKGRINFWQSWGRGSRQGIMTLCPPSTRGLVTRPAPSLVPLWVILLLTSYREPESEGGHGGGASSDRGMASERPEGGKGQQVPPGGEKPQGMEKL